MNTATCQTRLVTALYETIGQTYASTRVPDHRIAAQLVAALGTARTVLNVGGGAGNYEPVDRTVVAVDPSVVMLRQRTNTTTVVQGVAEALPFANNSFEVAMGTFTLHHWPDLAQGLAEVKRVAARQVFLMYEPSFAYNMWILRYFPEILDLPHEQRAPSVNDISALLSVTEVQVVPVPSDCTDGFGGAYWARPEMYLEPSVQAGMSMLAVLPDQIRAAGTQRLRSALESGQWDSQYGHLRTQDSADLGYRLILAGP
jgi:SAM-dependent methyltransferase